MPMLNYQCQECGSKFEELVNSYNQDRVACPDCEGHELQRIYEGKCLFGSTGGSGKGTGSSCSGCAKTGGCSGCAH